MSYQPKSYNKFLAGAATAAVVASAVVPVATHAAEKKLTDVKEGSYYAEAVNALAEAGVIKGYEDGTFRPNNQVTRAEVAKIIAVQLGLDTENAGTANYSDAKGHWANTGGYLAAVAKAGIMKGDGNGTFRPNAPLTRAEMASIVVRAYDLQAKEGFESQFKDLNAGGAWAADAIKTLEANGYANGIAKGQFGSASNVKRADVAVFLFRVAKGEATPTVESVSAINNIEVNEGAETVNLPKEVEVTLSNGEKAQKAVEWDKKGLDLNKPGEYTLTGDVADTDLTASVKVVVKAVDPKVESVSAINAKEIKVTFNKPVKDSTVTSAAFTITKNNGTAVAISGTTDSITVAKDGRSAIITLATGLSNDDVVKVEIAKDVILTEGYDKLPAATFSDLKFNDTVAPKLLSAKAVDGTKVELTFDEPVDWTTYSGGISVNGGTLVAGANTTEAGNYTYTFTVSQLKSTNTVQILNIADYAGNKDALASTTINYTADTSIPEVQSIKAEDSDSFILTLNKAIDTIAKTNFTVKKGNYTFDSNDLTVKFVDAKGNLTEDINGEAAADGTTPSKYVKVTVPTQAASTNPLYGNNENSVTLDVSLNGYKNGTVLGKEYNGSVKLSKDLTAPKVVSSKLVTFDKAANTITIPFDKNISIKDLANYQNSIIVMNGSVKEPVTATTNGKNLVITVTGGLTDATYNVVLDKGLVIDGSDNVNEATSLSVNVNSAAAYVQKTGIFSSAFTNNKNVITVAYDVKVNDSAAQASSYLLNGSALPTGSVVYFTNSDKDTVNIELPSSYAVPINNLNAKLTLKANTVKVDDSTSADYGKTVSSSASDAKAIEEIVTLGDNVAPTVTNVEYVKDSTTGLATGLKLTFSENIKDTSVGSTFVIKQGSTSVSYTVTTGDAADDNVILLNFASTTLSPSNVVLSTSTTASDITLTDFSTNNTIGSISGISAK